LKPVGTLKSRLDPSDVILLSQTNRVAAEQKAERRFIQAGDVDDDGRSLHGIARPDAVIVALKAGYRAYGGIVFSTPAQ
jgi:hypothetical protein